ncbi:hypothetical protein [Amycolatopsis sp. NPDC051071]|uniref:hypothetical protein n=1 Tax=Amycolatopsis sp. NPDC051071 TaxID=3154637 RepID=UPI00343CD226
MTEATITVTLDRLPAAMGRRARKPVATAAVWLVTAAAGVAQMARPELLGQFRRDPAALAAGEWWRMVTPMFFQDGHLLGTVFNLAMLAVKDVLDRLDGFHCLKGRRHQGGDRRPATQRHARPRRDIAIVHDVSAVHRGNAEMAYSVPPSRNPYPPTPPWRRCNAVDASECDVFRRATMKWSDTLDGAHDWTKFSPSAQRGGMPDG